MSGRLGKYQNIRREFREDKFINLNPIQRGGVLTDDAKRVLVEFGNGYSICDWCPPKAARLDMIERPPIKEFYEDLAAFLNMDVARVVTRCREAKYIVFNMLGKPGDYIIIDSLAHYSTYIAAEAAKLKIKEVPHSGDPEYKVDLEVYRDKIEEVKRETGKLPALALLTHVDYLYGNLNDAAVVGKICKEYGIPFLLNAAYTAGIMPVDGKALEADIIVSSGHKSWAASSPTGILAMTKELADKILVRSNIVGDWSKRSFPAKELSMLGCTVMGAPLITLMASFPHVVERVKHWNEEIEKIRYLINELEKIEGTRQIGVKPKLHTLAHIETPEFYRVSQTHKRSGFFLYDELKNKNIIGVQAGLSKHFKINTYGLSWNKIKYVAETFQKIAEKYRIKIYR